MKRPDRTRLGSFSCALARAQKEENCRPRNFVGGSSMKDSMALHQARLNLLLGWLEANFQVTAAPKGVYQWSRFMRLQVMTQPICLTYNGPGCQKAWKSCSPGVHGRRTRSRACYFVWTFLSCKIRVYAGNEASMKWQSGHSRFLLTMSWQVDFMRSMSVASLNHRWCGSSSRYRAETEIKGGVGSGLDIG